MKNQITNQQLSFDEDRNVILTGEHEKLGYIRSIIYPRNNDGTYILSQFTHMTQECVEDVVEQFNAQQKLKSKFNPK